MTKNPPRLAEIEAIFWERADGMHLEERISVLNDRRDELCENLAYGTPSQKLQTQAAIARLNTEIKRVNRLLHNNAWSKAVKNIFGEEVWAQVRVEVERVEGFIYRGKSHDRDEVPA